MYYCRKDKIYNADSTKYSECSFEITMNNSCIGKNGNSLVHMFVQSVAGVFLSAQFFLLKSTILSLTRDDVDYVFCQRSHSSSF